MEELEEFLNMPILEQLYKVRKLPLEQFAYETSVEIKEIQEKIGISREKLCEFFKKISNNNYEDFIQKLNDFETEYGAEIYFWGKIFYKLGANDGYKLKRAFSSGIEDLSEDKTFIEYSDAELDDYIEHKTDHSTEEYKKLKAEYNEIVNKYPRVLNVYSDLEPIALNEEEMQMLVKLRKIDMEMRALENKLCFKLGMNEILNF